MCGGDGAAGRYSSRAGGGPNAVWASAATPMTCQTTDAPASDPTASERPIGSRPGHTRRAVSSLTITASRGAAKSALANARPRTIGIPSVAR